MLLAMHGNHRSLGSVLTIALALVAAGSLSRLAAATNADPATRIDSPVGASSLLDCENLSYPGPVEFRLCVTNPSDPQSSPVCTTVGDCSCTGAQDCMDLGTCKDCESCECNRAGCTCTGCTDAPEPGPECTF